MAVTVEVRGSQGRVTLFFRNQSPAELADFSVACEDASGLTRFEVGPGPASIPGLNSGQQQQIMLECMKPVSGGPSMVISFTDPLAGRRSTVLPLPLLAVTFNDPLSLPGADFVAR